MKPPFQLTPLQLAVLRVLWRRGEATVTEVREALREERSLAQNTVATILSRLEKQGLVAHRSEGRSFVYRALLAETEAEERMVGELAERVFDGDLTRLFNHLVGREDLGPGELAAIKELIEARERETRREEN